MRKFAAALPALCLLCLGCRAPGNSYVEGTVTQLGMYTPVDGQIYGAEIVNYMNGCRISSSCTNALFDVDRTYTATNEWLWGAARTVERTETRIRK